MSNIFDQFDETDTVSKGNVFDRFDREEEDKEEDDKHELASNTMMNLKNFLQ